MAHLRPGVSVDRFREEVDGLLRGLAETGPGAEELARAHVQTERDWLLEMATVDSRADMINLYESVLGGAGKVNDYLDRVRAVTAEQVQAAAASWLDPGRASVIVHHRAQEESE
jgi:predicted Zn-dependent peptidase